MKPTGLVARYIVPGRGTFQGPVYDLHTIAGLVKGPIEGAQQSIALQTFALVLTFGPEGDAEKSGKGRNRARLTWVPVERCEILQPWHRDLTDPDLTTFTGD